MSSSGPTDGPYTTVQARPICGEDQQRVASLIRNAPPPRITIGPWVCSYCRVLGGGYLLWARYPCISRPRRIPDVEAVEGEALLSHRTHTVCVLCERECVCVRHTHTLSLSDNKGLATCGGRERHLPIGHRPPRTRLEKRMYQFVLDGRLPHKIVNLFTTTNR